MLEIYNNVLLRANLPKTWADANITLIPKEDSDLQQIKNYRPILLLNVQYKIYASIVAERLKRFLNDFIHPDQNGFLPKRQSKNNMRIVLNTLEYYEVHSEKQLALILLNAQNVGMR
uniref:Uncharacterized protein n=1 Tax=Micrurus paraensis TaxID=1970185 RepID=A0A2D4JTZ4_9SAUR